MKVWIKKIFITLATIMMVALCGLFAACGEPEAIDQTTIKYDGKTITWQAVDAEKYEVSINGGTAYTAPTAAFNYPVDSSVEMVEITITAYNGDKASESVTKLFTRLPKIEVSTITFDENGKMSWPAVAGATEYALKINGQEKRTPATEYEDFVAGQTNTIQIMPVAVGDSSFSEWSTQLNKEYLAPPSNIKYDGQYITWSGSAVAKSYQIYINGAKKDLPVVGASFEYNAQNSSFDLQIQAIGDGTTSFHSKLSEVKRYVWLADITGFAVEDGILSWTAVEEATGYMVKLNDNAAQFVETNTFKDIPANKDNVITVKPVIAESDSATTFYSNWSQPQNVRILVAPDLKWNEGQVLDGQKMNSLSWDPITGDVGGYNVKVVDPNGIVRIDPLSAGAVQYGNEAFEITGSYQISIQTFPVANSNSYHSQYSEPITVTRLPAPNQVQNWITSTANNVKEGFNLQWEAVSGATGYQLYKEAEKIKTTNVANIKVNYSDFMSEDETAEKIINFSVQSIGSVKTFATERKVTLSSLTSQNRKAQITVLGQPKELKIDGYVASWTTDTSASGYSVTVGDRAYSSTGTYDLQNLESGSYKFGVCANGNGHEILASNYTPTKTIERLAAPTNVRIDTSDPAQDSITWDAYANWNKYEVYFDNDTGTSYTQNQMQDIMARISKTGSAINVLAVANYWDSQEAIYYMTSKPSQTVTFTKMDAPTFNNVKVDDAGNLVWNAPANVQNVTIRYRVYDASNSEPWSPVLDGCQYLLTGLVGGQTYKYKVKAIGDAKGKDAFYVSSDFSAEASFTKLKTPEIKAPANNDNAYKWNNVGGWVENYIVKVEGKVVKTIPFSELTTEYSYNPAPDFLGLGTYSVEIYAQGDGEDTIDSDSWTKKQDVVNAEAPSFTVSYCDASGVEKTQYVTNGKIVVTVNPVNVTAGYEVSINESGGKYILEDATELKWVEDCMNAGEYKIKVFANGGEFGANGKYYIASSPNAVEQKIFTILQKPGDVSYTSRTGEVKCSATGSDLQYNWTVEYMDSNNMKQTETFTTMSNTQILVDALGEAVTSVINVKVYVSNRYGSTNVIASEEASWKQ